MDIKPSRFATFEHGDWSGPMEHGIVLDHSHDSTRGFALRLLSFTRELSEKMGRSLDGRAIAEPADDGGYTNDEDEMIAECMSLLSDLAPEGWYFEISDNSLFFFRNFETTIGFDIERKQDDGGFLHCDGETFSAESGAVWAITVNGLDEDGDAAETLGTIGATWAGGRAVYVNLYSIIGDAEDHSSLVAGLFVQDGTEVIHMGDDMEARSLLLAEQKIKEWCQGYADGTSWQHDASHYGFPY